MFPVKQGEGRKNTLQMIQSWKQVSCAEKQIHMNETLSGSDVQPASQVVTRNSASALLSNMVPVLHLHSDYVVYCMLPVNQAVLFQANYGCTDVKFKA